MKKIVSKLLLIFNLFAAAGLLICYLAPFINPSGFLLPALFGLAYPYILLVNLLFFFYYMVRLKKEALISLIVILAGWNHLNNLIPINFRKSETNVISEQSDYLKVLSYNVRAFDVYNWSKESNAKEEMLRFILDQNPDIVCLQEYYTTDEAGRRERDINRRLNSMPYNSVYYSFTDNRGSGWGIATYSKYPVIRRSRIPFIKTQNAAMYTDIQVNDDTIRILNIHLQSINFRQRNYDFIDNLKIRYSEEQIAGFRDIGSHLKQAFIQRAEQAEVISNYIKQSPYPVILMGDFNDTPVSYTYRKIRKGMNDAFRKSGKGFGNTYSGKFPSYRIDYILYSDHFKSAEFRRTKNKYSDHYPIQSFLWLKAENSE